MKGFARLSTAALVAGLAASIPLAPAGAQKGMGDQTGVARSGERPPVTEFSGTVTALRTGACRQSTGRAVTGTHLLMRRSDGTTVNLHLGPASVLESYADLLGTGASVAVRAFRTDAMPANAFVAQSVTVGEETITLRQPNLRPVWALGPGDGAGMGPGGGRGQGPGGGGMGPRGGRGQGPGGGQGQGSGGGAGMGQGSGGGMGPCWW